MGFRVSGLGFEFEVLGLGFGGWGGFTPFGVWGLGLMVWGLWFGVWCWVFRVWVWVSGFGFEVYGVSLGFRV